MGTLKALKLNQEMGREGRREGRERGLQALDPTMVMKVSHHRTTFPSPTLL